MKLESINGKLIVRDDNDKLIFIVPLHLTISRKANDIIYLQTESNYLSHSLGIDNNDVIEFNGVNWVGKSVDDLFEEIMKVYE